MAVLEFCGEVTREASVVKERLARVGIPYERWGLRDIGDKNPETILAAYRADIEQLKSQRGYVAQDVIALDPNTPNLEVLTKKFDREHHHTDDEVRFVVDGEGVFEINIDENERVKFTAEPGDLIVVPAMRRHLFYLTKKKTIRCIRLFKDSAGWEALYELSSHDLKARALFYGLSGVVAPP